jgi:hypothetical protein
MTMLETNKTKSISFLKKGLKWALLGALVGAMIGAFAGCMTASDTVYDDEGPCLSGKITIQSSGHSFKVEDTQANRALAAKRGDMINSCVRRASVNEKNARENERALVGAVAGAVGAAVLGGSLPLLAAAWFFFLTLLGQMFDAARGNEGEKRAKKVLAKLSEGPARAAK